MKQLLNPGKYVLAVSGGIDSVVLLNMLSNLSDVELIVAHFDHGIREDSKEDRKFVEDLAKQYNLRFEYAEGHLGKNASEDTARKARYKFLEATVKKYYADAIVTAHHQDDVIETMMLSIIRGTKRKGLSSLKSTDEVLRPLLHMRKKDILDYAKKNSLKWREDSTNQDEKFLRNWVRKNVVNKLDESQREELLNIYENAAKTNIEIDYIFAEIHGNQNVKLEKQLLHELNHKESTELVAYWLRSNDVKEFNSKQIEQIVVNAKTLAKGKTSPINKQTKIEYQDEYLEMIKE